jgi:hypothetical protein
MAIPAVAAAATSPPSITSAFTPTSIPDGGTSSLSFTISDPNSSGTLSGVFFTDTLPADLVVDNPNGENGTCGSSSTVTANPGASTISLSGGSLTGGTTCTVSVNVTSNVAGTYQNHTGTVTSSNGGSGNSDTESLSVIAPPTVSLGAPHNNSTYDFGKRVMTRFSCQEAPGGPGLVSCTGDVDDAGLNLNSGAPLPTKVAGKHTFTVTAISYDGAVTTESVTYKVRPDNRFTVSHVSAGSAGSVSFRIKVPGPGKIRARALSGGPTVTRKAGRAETVTVTVPSSGGKTGRIQITFTPKGGKARKVTISA